MTLLWGESPQPKAQQSLRQALMRLRRILGEDAIVGGRDRVGIRPGLIDCDVAAFERLVAKGDRASLDDALQLYAGPFLADVSLAEEEWTAWARAQQGRLESLALDAAVTLATAELDAGRWPRALGAAHRALAIDNLREDAHRLVIAALVAGGRRADALKHFEDLTALLKSELDVAPEPETQRLARQIRLCRIGRAGVRAGARGARSGAAARASVDRGAAVRRRQRDRPALVRRRHRGGHRPVAREPARAHGDLARLDARPARRGRSTTSGARSACATW